METTRQALTALFAICLTASASDALFDGAGDGLRLVCGLCAALCVARAAAGLTT